MGGWMGEGERETLGSFFTKLSLCYTNEELGYIWSTGEEGLYWIETWPRWDKRYSIESKLCYSSSSSLSSLFGSSLFIAGNGFEWQRRSVGVDYPLFFSTVPYFVDALVSQDNTMPLSVPNIAEIASSPPPPLLYTDVVSLQICTSFAPSILLLATYTSNLFSHLWSTL